MQIGKVSEATLEEPRDETRPWSRTTTSNQKPITTNWTTLRNILRHKLLLPIQKAQELIYAQNTLSSLA